MLEEVCVRSALSSREFCSQREKGNKPDYVKPAESRGVPSKTCVVVCCHYVLYSFSLVLMAGKGQDPKGNE